MKVFLQFANTARTRRLNGYPLERSRGAFVKSPHPRIPESQPLHGFTLVELLVVITIIGILIALLLPAVQAAREAARQTQCRNHLKQISLGWLNHEQTHGTFPSGGWGFRWVGDADRGFGIDQPGGWIYNILPYMEQEAIHQLGAGGSAAEKKEAAELLCEMPLSVMCCPSRRPPVLYPHRPDTANVNRPHNPGFDGQRCDDLDMVARGDYAANSGDVWNVSAYGPLTVAEADTYIWTEPSYCTGVSFIHAVYKMIDITDGTSHTYMVGEKYMNPNNYYTWDGVGDCQPMYIGYDPDINRTTDTAPVQDTPDLTASYSFGSAHSNGFHMALCDGSVRSISYTIDETVHACLGNRMDGAVLDAKSY